MVGSERHIDRSTVHEASGAKWHEQRVAALHLEATGPDCLQDRMVQAALVLVEPNGTVDGGWSRIVDPGVPIPVGAAGVHGINTEIARTQGVKPPMALTGLAEVLDEVAEGGIPLVIFNAPFGWTLLLAEAARHGIEIERVSIIDPLVCDQALDRYRKGKRTLDATARHYGRQLGGAPDARADAVATAAITRTLADRFPDLREHTPPQLHVHAGLLACRVGRRLCRAPSRPRRGRGRCRSRMAAARPSRASAGRCGVLAEPRRQPLIGSVKASLAADHLTPPPPSHWTKRRRPGGRPGVRERP